MLLQFPNAEQSSLYREQVTFYQADNYQENRRFGLWLEGVILGSLLGLLVFTIYSYYQIRDKTTLYFGLWLLSSIIFVIGQFHHDGSRLLEFNFSSIEYNPLFNSVSFATTIAVFSGYFEAMMFVIFARQFIGFERKSSSRLYIHQHISSLVKTAFLTFRVFNFEFDLRVIWYPLVYSTFFILALLFYCSIQRYQKGIVFIKFFIIGFLPYLIARIFHLLGVFGFQSPFAYLPDSGLQSFLNNHVVIQSVGLFIVKAIIMSLVLAKRTKFCKMS